MVERQIRRRGVRDRDLLAAMERVPRHRFVPERYAAEAYADGPVPIGDDQTISQPYVVAAMTEALGLKRGTHVLEIGAGSGYQTAVLLELGVRVTAIERLPRLADEAERRLHALGYEGFTMSAGDGSLGCTDAERFAGILVAAAAPLVPAALLDQLSPGGRLVMPVGKRRAQELLVMTRTRRGEIVERSLGSVVFVPLLGAGGFSNP
ncbi:MAG: protein-L-isoaspartate O-methyltransferase [Phycisphaeraceae bacterium]|nr:protein-L-isoaspartate O-methyltransferase [Phycisphaeraceae bacterium]